MAFSPGKLILMAAIFASGCVELDLGSTPFFCNNGTPSCPPGYICTQSGGARLCVKEGSAPPQMDGLVSKLDGKITPADQGVIKESGQTFDVAAPDVSVADFWPSTPDQYIKPDLPPPPDKGPKPDAPPKIGCQTNKECKTKDPQNPCCCPITIIWVCAPLCLNPLCFPI